jgi:WD40 repeat protein
VAWSPDSQYIASGGADATVQIWNSVTGDTLYTFRGHTATALSVIPDVRTVAWSPDGQYIASGGSDNTVVQVWKAG